MNRNPRLVLIALFLASMTGCSEAERANAVLSDLRAALLQWSASALPARTAMPPANREPHAATQDSEPPETESPERRLRPEEWLAAEAVQAWFGERDRPDDTRPLSDSSGAELSDDETSPGVESSDIAMVAPSDALVQDEDAGAQDMPEEELAEKEGTEEEGTEEEVAEEEIATEPEEEPFPFAPEQERWRRVASLFGAGSGFTGIGAGEAGYTGIGAGEGFTGIGAGQGFTGAGAGRGFTGLVASMPSETAPENPPSGSPAQSPGPVLVVVPTLLGPWYQAYGLY